MKLKYPKRITYQIQQLQSANENRLFKKYHDDINSSCEPYTIDMVATFSDIEFLIWESKINT